MARAAVASSPDTPILTVIFGALRNSRQAESAWIAQKTRRLADKTYEQVGDGASGCARDRERGLDAPSSGSLRVVSVRALTQCSQEC